MTRFTRLIGKTSISLLAPILFVATIGFLFLQTYLVTIPHTLEREEEEAKEAFIGIINHAQATINNLSQMRNDAALIHELKMLNIHDIHIHFAAVFDDNNTLQYISHRKHRRHAITSMGELLKRPALLQTDKIQKPYIYKGESAYQFHGIASVSLAHRQEASFKTHQGHILIEYDYADDIHAARASITNILSISMILALSLLITLGLLFYLFFFKKIAQLEKGARKLQGGRYGYQIEQGGFKEIQSIINSFNTMSQEIIKDIDTIRRNDDLLRYERDRAQTYLNLVDVMILVLDTDYNVVMLNRKGCEIIGYEFEDVVGKNWMENFLPPRLRKKVSKVGESLMKPDIVPVSSYENPILTKSGEERIISWRNTPLYGPDDKVIGLITSGEDVTEMRQAQQRLKESEIFYHSIFSSVHEAIFILDGSTVVDCNDIAIKLFNTSKEAFIGRDIMAEPVLFKCQDTPLETCLHDAFNGEFTTSLCSLTYEDDASLKIAEISFSPFEEGSGRVICTAHDLTEKLEQEKLIRIHTRQAQMGEMISMIAHQWRQPLTTISALTTHMMIAQTLSDTPDEDQLSTCKQIEQQVQHLSQTISDFRNFFRPDKEREKIRTSEIIRIALELLDNAITSRAIEITTEFSKDTELLTFKNELIQVLMTMIKNSIDAFEENKTTDKKLSFVLDKTPTQSLIIIEDNAGGIKDEIITEIFLPYFSTKDKKHGTGLGLYMCKTIVEEHCGGTLDVTSRDETTTFTIALPLEEEAHSR